MTLTSELDLDVKLNQHAKYLGQRIFRSNVASEHTHTGPIALSEVVSDCFVIKYLTECIVRV